MPASQAFVQAMLDIIDDMFVLHDKKLEFVKRIAMIPANNNSVRATQARLLVESKKRWARGRA